MVPTSALLKSPEDVGRTQEAADELQVAAQLRRSSATGNML